MSELIREARQNAKNWADKPESAAMWNRFADEIERLTAENKKLVAAICAFMDAEGSEPTTFLSDVLKEVNDE